MIVTDLRIPYKLKSILCLAVLSNIRFYVAARDSRNIPLFAQVDSGNKSIQS
jgi:hypothetical protein